MPSKSLALFLQDYFQFVKITKGEECAMKMKSISVLALGFILGTASVALSDPFSTPMTNDLYNGNTPNSIPTPYFTPGIGYNLFDAANLLNPGYGFQKNEDLDSKLFATDYSWKAVQGSTLSFFVIGYSAKNVNSLGYYVRDGNNIIKSTSLLSDVSGFGFVGDGQSQTTGFLGVDFIPFNNTFGWYIDTTDWRTPHAVTSFYSEAQLNPDGYDHLITYALPELEGLSFYIKGMTTPHMFTENAYLIGFKDRLFNLYSGYPGYPNRTLGDDDFNDIMILVDSTEVNPALAPPLVPEPATITLVATGLAGLFLYGRRRRQ
jgi:hypothetical protein